jgi:hypothetical protein
VRPVNVMLDAECMAILQRMPGGSSQAVRQALRFWALHHPPQDEAAS